ncbi:unnamed protein product [Rotaria sp. Silwood1]|nr:unnamed protein product [Rotaria sp. Silwood1]
MNLFFRSLGRPINDKEIKVNQLLEHQNQNASTHLIIDYLDLIKKIIQLLRYSNLFDFDQLLISTQIGSIEETSFFIWVFFSKTIAYSTYQR